MALPLPKMAWHVLLPPANEVWGKVIFLHLFVILFTGGVPGLGGAWSRRVPGPGGCLVPGGVPGQRGCAWSRGAWWRPPPPPGRLLLRPYASYWNAFLLVIKLSFIRLISSCRLYQVNMTKVTQMTLRK